MFTGASQAFPSLVNHIAHCLWSCSRLMSSWKHASPFSTAPGCFGVCRARHRSSKTATATRWKSWAKHMLFMLGRPSWRRDRLTPALQRTWTAPWGATAGCYSCRTDHMFYVSAAQGWIPRKQKLSTAASGSCFTQNQFPPLAWLGGIQGWKVEGHVGATWTSHLLPACFTDCIQRIEIKG